MFKKSIFSSYIFREISAYLRTGMCCVEAPATDEGLVP